MPEIEGDDTPLAPEDRIINYCDGCSTNHMWPRTLVKAMAEQEDKRIRCDTCGNLFQALNSRRASELPGLQDEHVFKARADSDSRSYQRGDIVETYKS